MTTATLLQRLVRQLRRTAEARQLDDSSDTALLERFQRDADPGAFETIVRRHGPSVLGTCRKVLTSQADVEDAFQATFVVLLQTAKTIRKRHQLGSWLCGVAHRIAVKALAAKVRRQRLEQRPQPLESEGPDLSWREACGILHEELDRLPETYRLPLVLCYLDGKSRDEAAQQLGVKTDVLRGRLERGRERLRGRLIQRGVALSAGLLAAVVANSVTAGGPPEQLLRATLKATLGGRVPGSVAALVHGAKPAMTLGKFKLVAVALLAIGLMSTGVALSMSGAESPQAKTVRQTSFDPKPAEPAKENAITPIEVKGRVLDADGKPVAKAKLYLIGSKREKKDAITVADDDGRFRFVVKPEEVGDNDRLLAAADGLAPDWIDLAHCGKGDVTLHLPKDDVPFIGRVVTLEGQPVVGATVEAVRIGKPADTGELTPWIENNVKQRKENSWVNERGLLLVAPSAFGPKLTATTDKDGKFRLTGGGRGRVLSVRVSGAGVEHKFFWVVTRSDAPKDPYIKTADLNYGLYGPELQVLLGPSKPIVGTVHDKATGKPVAGIKVQETHSSLFTAVTDAEGRYRLEGVPKKSAYFVTAAGGKGVPYFDSPRRDTTDTAGLDAITVDFELYRGIEITGHVVDKATGKPVAAEGMYFVPQDNPNLKNYPNFGKPGVIISDWGRPQKDGTFTLLAIPGPGVVCVSAKDENVYSALDGKEELKKLNVRNVSGIPLNAIVLVNPDPDKPESLTVKAELTAGKARQVAVVDADDKPLEGVQIAGLKQNGGLQTLKTAEFGVTGLGDGQRILLFLHSQRKLGGVAVVKGAGDEPIVAKLRPLGTVEGQVVDGDGKACPGFKVKLTPELPREPYENLPIEPSKFQGLAAFRRGLWPDFIGRDVVTDKDGRFKLEGVLPDVDFTLYVGDGDLAQPRTLVVQRTKVRVEPGKAQDLGTLKTGDGLKKQ